MKVKDLIRQLKRLPPDVDVYFSAHDQDEFEVTGEASSVYLLEKEDYYNTASLAEPDMVARMPEKWVVIRP